LTQHTNQDTKDRQWEKDKIKHKKDLAEYEIWKNNEKIKSLK
jgi:hypothetical protein